MELSGWRVMWLIVCFDLPTLTPGEKKEYVRFRKALLDDGFDMMQYSVYMRCCPSEENAAVHSGRVRGALPPDGKVNIVRITDRQFGRIEVYLGKKRKKTPEKVEQLQFF